MQAVLNVSIYRLMVMMWQIGLMGRGRPARQRAGRTNVAS